jgi:hypothetical protein
LGRNRCTATVAPVDHADRVWDKAFKSKRYAVFDQTFFEKVCGQAFFEKGCDHAAARGFVCD